MNREAVKQETEIEIDFNINGDVVNVNVDDETEIQIRVEEHISDGNDQVNFILEYVSGHEIDDFDETEIELIELSLTISEEESLRWEDGETVIKTISIDKHYIQQHIQYWIELYNEFYSMEESV